MLHLRGSAGQIDGIGRKSVGRLERRRESSSWGGHTVSVYQNGAAAKAAPWLVGVCAKSLQYPVGPSRILSISLRVRSRPEPHGIVDRVNDRRPAPQIAKLAMPLACIGAGRDGVAYLHEVDCELRHIKFTGTWYSARSLLTKWPSRCCEHQILRGQAAMPDAKGQPPQDIEDRAVLAVQDCALRKAGRASGAHVFSRKRC